MNNENIIYHSTCDIIESMLFHDSLLHIPLRHLNIISIAEGRSFSAVCHPELDGIISKFFPENNNGLRIITVIGTISVTAIIPIESGGIKQRLHNVLYIIGKSSRIEQQSWSLIIRELNSYLNFTEFMPESFCKKIVYFESWNENSVNGMLFSEVGKNLWSIGDPMKLPLQQTLKTTAIEIITQILSDVKEASI